MNRYVANLSDNHSATVSAKVNYKDIMTSFFAYIQGSASREWSDIIYGMTLDDNNRTLLQEENMPHHSEKYTLTGDVSKGFDWKETKIELKADYAHNSSSVLLQSVKTPYHSNAFSIYGNATVNIINAVRLGYDCSYSYLRSVSSDYSHTIRTFQQHACLDASFLPSRLMMNIKGNHTHNSDFQDKKNCFFLDASFTYRTKRKTDFVLEGRNLFNTHIFVSRSDTDMIESYEIYDIRSRSVLLTVRFSL